MKQYILTVLSIFVLTGCVFHNAPEEDVKYSETILLYRLAGVYKNAGDPDKYLSQILFGATDMKSKGIAHEDIRFIDVAVTGNLVTVKAFTDDCEELQKEYLLGRDFEIKDGKIVLTQDFSFLTRGLGDPLVGPSYEKAIITLDQSGHGIYKNEAFAAGLAFLLIPIAVAGTSEVRFERLDGTSVSEKCSITNKTEEPIKNPRVVF